MTAPFVFIAKINGHDATISIDHKFHFPYQNYADEFINNKFPLSQADIFFENKCIEFFHIPPSFRAVRDKYYYGRRDIFYWKIKKIIEEKQLQYPDLEELEITGVS